MNEHDMAKWWMLCPYRMAKAFGADEVNHWANTSKVCAICLHRHATETPKREKLHVCWKRFLEEISEVE